MPKVKDVCGLISETDADAKAGSRVYDRERNNIDGRGNSHTMPGLRNAFESAF